MDGWSNRIICKYIKPPPGAGEEKKNNQWSYGNRFVESKFNEIGKLLKMRQMKE